MSQSTSDHRNLTDKSDDLLLGLLFFLQALPMGIAWLGLPPLLRSAGVSLETIGATALCALPWALKFVWAVAVEKRCMIYGCRPVILICNVLSLTVFIFLAQIDLVNSLNVALIALVILNGICATQDVATDRYAIIRRGIVGAERVNTARFVGFALGMLFGGSGMLMMVALTDWKSFAFICVLIILLINLYVLKMPKGNDSTTSHQSIGLSEFLKKPMAWKLLGIAVVFKSAFALSDGLIKSFWVDRGFQLDQISFLTAINIAVAGLIGAPIGAWLIKYYGGTKAIKNPAKVAIGAGVLTALIVLILGVMIKIGVGMVHSSGLNAIYVALPVMLVSFDGVASLAFFVMFMRWSVGIQPGTTFTLFLCAESLGSIIMHALAGLMAAKLGYAIHFMVSALIAIVAMYYINKTINLYLSTITQEQQDAMA